MKIKRGVRIDGLHPKMRKVRIEANRIWAKYGKELVITSGREMARHSAGSLHYDLRALDLRTRYFKSEEEKIKVRNELAEALGEEYDVVLEVSHIHAEYDPV